MGMRHHMTCVAPADGAAMEEVAAYFIPVSKWLWALRKICCTWTLPTSKRGLQGKSTPASFLLRLMSLHDSREALEALEVHDFFAFCEFGMHMGACQALAFLQPCVELCL